MRKTSSPTWRNSRAVGLLCQLYPTHSANKIADLIGSGCTKNMVIGKARRLGLMTSKKWHGKTVFAKGFGWTR